MKDFSHELFDDYFWYPKVNSTSTQALKLIQDKAVHGHFLVVSEMQTNGHGRQRSHWFSPRGGIWMTAALYGLPEQSNLTILIGNAIHQSLLSLFPRMGSNLMVKWPNDLMLEDKKVAGILTEQYSAYNYTLIGIGIDTNIEEFPEDLRLISTSLSNYLGIQVDNCQIATYLFDTVASNLPVFLEKGIDEQIMYHNRFSYLQNKFVEITTDFGSYKGLVKYVNREGALVLQLESGLVQPFFSGSVNILQ